MVGPPRWVQRRELYCPTSQNSQMTLWSKASLPSPTTFECVHEKNKTKFLFHPSHSLWASLCDGEELCLVLRHCFPWPTYIYKNRGFMCEGFNPHRFLRVLVLFSVLSHG